MSIRRTLLILTLLACAAGVAAAQEKPVPPPKEFKPETAEAKKSLPSLNLPEYVITGADVIAFSGYSKEELAVADPASFSKRAGRGTRESWYGDPRPVKDLISPSEIYGNKYTSLLRVGFGSFSTPYLEAWYNNSFTKADINAHTVIEKSDGHVDDAGYSRFAFDINGGSWFPSNDAPLIARSRIEGKIAYRYHDYGLYANAIPLSEKQFEFDRTTNELDFGVGLVSRENALFDYSARLFGEHTSMDDRLSVHAADTALFDFDAQEFTIGTNISVATQAGELPLRGTLLAAVSDAGSTPGSEDTPGFFQLRGESEYWFRPDLMLRFGAMLFSLANSDGTGSTSAYPTLYGEYYFDNEMRVFLGYTPSVDRNSIRRLIGINPYLTVCPVVRHQETPVAFQLGLAYDVRKGLALSAYVDYRETDNYPAFVRLPQPLNQQWDVDYSGTSKIFSLHAETEVRVSNVATAAGEFIVRSSENSLTGASVVYLPNYEFSFVYTHRFPFGLRLLGSLKVLGDRRADEEDLGTLLYIGGEAQYWIIENVGAFLRVSNIIDQTYQLWQGYDQAPLFLMAGIQARF